MTPGSDDLPLSPGALFGGLDGRRFAVQEQVGRGGQAIVYRVLDNRLGRPLAAKVCVAPDAWVRDDYLARFERELKLTSRAAHPHVVGVYDVGEIDGGFPYLLLEWMEGGSLGACLERLGADGLVLPLGWIRYYAEAIGVALRAAHAVDVIHRDLKPDNVLLGADGVAKLTDFGMARDLADPSPPLTAPGAGVGTPGFMAAEHFDGLSGPLSDVFSFGVTLFVAITGQPMPQLRGPGQVPVGMALPEAWELPPPALVPMLQALCAAHPEDRPRSVQAALDLALAADWSEVERPVAPKVRLPPLPARVFSTGSTAPQQVQEAEPPPAPEPEPAPEPPAPLPDAAPGPSVHSRPEPVAADPPRRGFGLPITLALAAVVVGLLLLLARSDDAPEPTTSVDRQATMAPAPSARVEVEPDAPTPEPSASEAAVTSSAPALQPSTAPVVEREPTPPAPQPTPPAPQPTAEPEPAAPSDVEVQESAIAMYNRRADGWPAAVEAALARPSLANAAALNFAGLKPAYDGRRYAATVHRAEVTWDNLDKGYALSSSDVAFVAELGCRASAQLALSGNPTDDGYAWCDRWLQLAEQAGQPTGPIEDLLEQVE